MIEPTSEDIVAAKAECRKKFGHERIVQIVIGDPIGVTVLMAAFNLTEASAYSDARHISEFNARSALISERRLFPGREVFDAYRNEKRLPAIDEHTEAHFRFRMGFNQRRVFAARFSLAGRPPSMPEEKAQELLAKEPADQLWTIYDRAADLELVMRSPTSDVWASARSSLAKAAASHTGTRTTVYDYAKNYIRWSPRPLDEYLDEKPGRALDIADPFFDMGGSAAEASSSFL